MAALGDARPEPGRRNCAKSCVVRCTLALLALSLALCAALGAGAGAKVRSRPAARETRRVRGRWLEIEVGAGTFSVADFGAAGDGKTADTKAIQAALDAAAAAGGGTVLLSRTCGRGVYLTGPFRISGSHVMVQVPAGVRVVFEADHRQYAGIPAMISAKGVSHVGLSGGGVFDGQGASWWPCRDSKECPPRPLMLNFHGHHLLMQDVTFKDSPNHVLELYSDWTELAGVTVLAPPSDSKVPVNGTVGPSHNTDAVDVHGSPFYIHHCRFDNGDDNVAVHGNDLLVEDCYFGHGHGASIGSISDEDIRNVTFRNIVFNRTTTAVRIKTRSKGRGSVHNCTWENLVLHEDRRSEANPSLQRSLRVGGCSSRGVLKGYLWKFFLPWHWGSDSLWSGGDEHRDQPVLHPVLLSAHVQDEKGSPDLRHHCP